MLPAIKYLAAIPRMRLTVSQPCCTCIFVRKFWLPAAGKKSLVSTAWEMLSAGSQRNNGAYRAGLRTMEPPHTHYSALAARLSATSIGDDIYGVHSVLTRHVGQSLQSLSYASMRQWAAKRQQGTSVWPGPPIAQWPASFDRRDFDRSQSHPVTSATKP